MQVTGTVGTRQAAAKVGAVKATAKLGTGGGGGGGSTSIVVKTSSYAIQAGDSEIIFVNTGAGGLVTLTLPAATQNLHFRFIVTNANGIKVQLHAGDSMQVGNGNATAGGYAQSTILGACLDLFATASGQWFAFNQDNNWSLT